MTRWDLIKKAVKVEGSLDRARERAYATGNWAGYHRLHAQWERLQDRIDAIDSAAN